MFKYFKKKHLSGKEIEISSETFEYEIICDALYGSEGMGTKKDGQRWIKKCRAEARLSGEGRFNFDINVDYDLVCRYSKGGSSI